MPLLVAVLLLTQLLSLPADPDRVRSADRDAWQRPDAVMDALGIRAGSRVADVGAGTGYFTFQLARRVGVRGRVYAVDVQRAALDDLARQAAAAQLPQVVTVVGTDDDPRLPPGSVDVILIVNTYHEFRAFDEMMASFRAALKPGGRLGIIEPKSPPDELPGRAFRHHRISPDMVRDDASRAGLEFVRFDIGFVNPDAALDSSYWFFLIFRKPA